MSADLSIITDQGYVSQSLNVLNSFVALDEILFEEGVVKIVGVHCRHRHKIALNTDQG